METEIFWRAVTENDARFDGAFYLGVKTTGIYCRPSCRAKQPRRENVAFFATGRDAERAGLRACLRCKPDEVAGIDPRVAKVLAVCDMLGDDPTLSLDGLADEVGLSPSHLQRSFKETIGVSPKKFAAVQRTERFKSELRSGSDVVTAMYDAGFNSSSRLYSNAAESLGMKPSVYKKGGEGMTIVYTITESELGRMIVARTEKGICNVAFADDEATLETNLRSEFPNAEILLDDGALRTFVHEILDHLAGRKKRLDLPLDIQATAFQMKVWELLRKIPYGETISYGHLAEQMGDKKKVRAVAQACAKNRIAVVIPCHRVIASDGKPSGYRWGVERKKSLLTREQPN